MNQNNAAEPLKLPVFDTIKKSFQLLINRPATLFIAAWSFAAVSVLSTLLQLFTPYMQFRLLSLLGTLLSLIAIMISAINIYRFVLLGEKPEGLGLVLKKRHGQFVIWGIKIFLILLVGTITLGLLMMIFSRFSSLAATLLFLAAFVLATIAVYRLSFLWPAMALDQKTSWRKSFAQTKGNVLRMMLGYFLIVFPIYILVFIASFLLANSALEPLIQHPQVYDTVRATAAVHAFFNSAPGVILLIIINITTFAIFVVSTLFTALSYYYLVPEARNLSASFAKEDPDSLL